jgi:hypothetical protein
LDAFGVTPSQVDEMPLTAIDRIPEIHAVALRIRKEAQEKANRG